MNQRDDIQAGKMLNHWATELISTDAAYLVHYWGVNPQHYNNPVHRHSFFEVCYVVSGAGFYEENERILPLAEGTLFLSRPGIWHQIRSNSGLYLLYVAFEIQEQICSDSVKALLKELATTQAFHLTAANESFPVRIWLNLLDVAELGSAKANKELIRSLAHSLLTSFLGFFQAEAPTDLALLQENPRSTLLHQSKLYIADNLTKKLNMEQVANYLHISPRHLSRLFSQGMQQSFSHYLQEQRVKKAIELLQHTDWPISKISEESGFDSVHYFTRVFSAKIGVPPVRFRQKHFETPTKSRQPAQKPKPKEE